MNSKTNKSIDILLVDDDTLYLSYMSGILESEGFTVHTAINGNEGLERYSQYEPNLIITDIVMPEKEGLEFIMDIRAKDKDIPIFAVTGAEVGLDGNYLKAAKRFGANVVLSKPHDPELLITTMDQYLNNS